MRFSTFGGRLRYLRCYGGYTQIELSLILERRQDFIADVENNVSMLTDGEIQKFSHMIFREWTSRNEGEVSEKEIKRWLAGKLTSDEKLSRPPIVYDDADLELLKQQREEETRKRLIELRKSKGLTKKNFGEGAGYSAGHISRIEKGIGNSSKAFLKKIAETYFVSYEWLAFGFGDMISEEQKFEEILAYIRTYYENHPDDAKAFYQKLKEKERKASEIETIDKNGRGTQEDIMSEIVAFCATPRTLSDICKRLGYKKGDSVRKYLTPLLEEGRMRMTVPDKPKSRMQKYMAVT